MVLIIVETMFVRCLAIVVVTLLLAAACGSSSEGEAEPSVDGPVVVATTAIWADVVDNVACGLASVSTLTPRGTDPHAFEPSLADRAEMDRASLVIANGLGLEESLTDTIEAVEDGGVAVLRLAETMPVIEGDPHVWFDPQLVAGVVPLIADALTADAGLDPDAVQACAAQYSGALIALDADLQSLAATIPPDRRILVTNHDSLSYLAARYGFEVLGTVIPGRSSLAETNAADLAELEDLIVATGVPAIFAENESSVDDAEALANRIGVPVIRLDTGNLGAEGSSTETYVDFMRRTMEIIVEALAPAQ